MKIYKFFFLLLGFLLLAQFNMFSQFYSPNLPFDQQGLHVVHIGADRYLVLGGESNGSLFDQSIYEDKAVLYLLNSTTASLSEIKLASPKKMILYKKGYFINNKIVLFGDFEDENLKSQACFFILNSAFEVEFFKELKSDKQIGSGFTECVFYGDSNFVVAITDGQNGEIKGTHFFEVNSVGEILMTTFFKNIDTISSPFLNRINSLTGLGKTAEYYFTTTGNEERLYKLGANFDVVFIKNLPLKTEATASSPGYVYSRSKGSIVHNNNYFVSCQFEDLQPPFQRQMALLVYNQNLDSLTTVFASVTNGYHYLAGFDADSLGNKYLVGYDKFSGYKPDSTKNNKVLFSKVNPDNSIAYIKSYRDGSTFLPQGITALANGGCAITGYRYKQEVTNDGDLFIMLLDVKGNVTALSSFMKQTTVKLFPNPSSGSVMLEWPSDKPLARLSIYNVAGKLLFEKQGNMQQGEYLSLEFLAAGMYLVNLYFEDGETLSKLLELNQD